MEIPRVRRAARAADRNASEFQNAARVATAALARAQAHKVGVAPRVATPSQTWAGILRQSENASSRRQANLRPPANLEGG